jgi:two-component system, cell cycle response regulator
MIDQNVATHLSDLIPQAGDGPTSNPALPMYLIVLAGGIPGAMIRLQNGGTRLGRSADNTLQLQDPGVSRYHAVLRSGEDGKVRLTDLASTNGTFLNGRRVTNHTSEVLHDGDRLRFGSMTSFKFVRPDPYEEQFQREMFERTVRDAVTGLYNRSYFLDQVDVLLGQSAQKGLGLAILMIDIDRFKQVNDTFGHHAGDLVLREVAGVIRQSTRSQDLVARYGGEEFVVALPIATHAQAADRAERIRVNLAGKPIAAGGKALRITASIGTAFVPAGRTRPMASLIAAADSALYKAKNAGRDRVVCSAGRGSTAPEPSTCDDEIEDQAAPISPVAEPALDRSS